MPENEETCFESLDLRETIPMKNIGSDNKPHYVADSGKIIKGKPKSATVVEGMTHDEVRVGELAETAEHFTMKEPGKAINSKGDEVKVIGWKK